MAGFGGGRCGGAELRLLVGFSELRTAVVSGSRRQVGEETLLARHVAGEEYTRWLA